MGNSSPASDAVEAVFATIIPIIDSVLMRRRRALRCSEADVEDIRASVIARILNRLRERPDDEIGSLRDYVAVATYHAIDDFFRQAAPQRHALKNRLRYILRRDDRLMTWDIGRLTVAGLVEWQGVNCYLDELSMKTLPLEIANRAKPAAAVFTVIASAGLPIALDALVSVFMDAWQIPEQAGFLPLPEADLESIVHGADVDSRLADVWREIRRLPLAQRRALLLNLRDGERSNALTALLSLNLTTMEGLSSALELDLTALWNSLPLADRDIAAILGITRQQVINLRLAARRRLRRHVQLSDIPMRETILAHDGEKCT